MPPITVVHRVAPSGHFLQDVLLGEGESAPADCVATHPPQGLWWPRWAPMAAGVPDPAGAWADAGVPFVVDEATGLPIIPEDSEE